MSLGYMGVAILMFVENILPPIPSELIMPLSGYMAAQDAFTLLGISIAGTIGSLLGAVALYYLGYAVGEERLKHFADRYGRWLTVSSRDIERSKHWFERHGATAVLVGRLIPGVRSIISIPAGVARMNVATFVVCTLIGSGIWAGLLAYAGYFLGTNFERVQHFIDPLSKGVIAIVVLFYLVRVARFKRM